MYKICIIEDSAQRQRELENSFLSVLNTHTYEDLSISDLCSHMGVSRKCFYRYFSGKKGILFALLDHTLMDFEISVQTADLNHDRLSETLKLFFEFWEKQKNLLDILERDGLSTLLYQRVLELFSHEATFFSRFIPVQSDRFQEQRLHFVICGMMTMAISWHHQKYQPSINHMIQAAETILTQPLFRE